MPTADSSNLFEQHDRVRQHTPAKGNARIDAKTRRELARAAGMDDARVVEARLDELSPVAVFRRLGYRTQQEICSERRVPAIPARARACAAAGGNCSVHSSRVANPTSP